MLGPDSKSQVTVRYENGKPVGLDHELFQLMKAEAKFDLRQENIPWTGLLAGVSSGKYDAAVTGALINQLRPSGMDWAVPSSVAGLDLTAALDRLGVGKPAAKPQAQTATA